MILFTSLRGTAVGVWPLSVTFTDSSGVGVEAAEELAKATGVCVSVRAPWPVGVREQRMERPLSGPQGKADTMALGEEGTGWGTVGDLTPVDCLFLRRAAEGVGRCCSHNNLGWVSLSRGKCTPCVHLDMRIKSRIIRYCEDTG